jgi:hypothetical protein
MVTSQKVTFTAVSGWLKFCYEEANPEWSSTKCASMNRKLVPKTFVNGVAYTEHFSVCGEINMLDDTSCWGYEGARF